MSPRTGRPKTDNPKGTQLAVRLDAETLQKLDENAAYYKESRVESLRRGIEEVNRNIKKENP